MDNNILQSLSSLLDAKLEPINDRLNKIDKHFDAIDEKLDKTDARLYTMNKRLDSIEQETRKTSVIQENEVVPNIKIMSEGNSIIIERLKRVEEKTNEIEDIKDTVSVLKAFVRRDK